MKHTRLSVKAGTSTAAAALAFAAAVCGCSTQPKMSKSDQENFKGGPMPPDFLEKQGGVTPAAAPPAAGTPATAAPETGAKGAGR